MPKRDRAEYMRTYRKTNPELTPGQVVLRNAWAAGLEDLSSRKTPIHVSFDGRQLTAGFDGAFAQALVVLSGYRVIVPDTGLEWMYTLLCIALWGDKWPKAAHRLGIPPQGPVPPPLSLDELRKLIFGGVVITEEDWKNAKEIHNIAKTQRKREGIPMTKSQLDSYFDNLDKDRGGTA
jgi:hypothetical protein